MEATCLSGADNDHDRNECVYNVAGNLDTAISLSSLHSKKWTSTYILPSVDS